MPSGIYIRTKPVWNKGLRKETDIRVRKLSEKLKNPRKPMSIEAKLKNSISHQKLWQHPKYQEKQHLSHIGICNSRETIEKQRQSLIKNYKEHPETKQKIGQSVKDYYKKYPIKVGKFKNKHHTKEVREKIRIARLSQIIPFHDTQPELILQNGLVENNISFEKHKSIENFVQSDLFINPNIVIFIDGCYFHACPICYSDRTKLDVIQNKTIVRDTLVNQFFNNLNGKYIVLRFWEHEIYNNFDSIVDKIMKLWNREINCECGNRMDRDYNASINIMNLAGNPLCQ